jgi:hypothetical protein
MFYVSPEGGRYYLGRAFDYNDLQYTKAGATHDKFIELGFTQVIPQQRPDDRFYIVNQISADGSYSSTPRDLGQLKASFSAEQLNTANGILQQSDFVFIRLAEEGAGTVTVPAALPTQRDEVRTVCKDNIKLITDCKSVAALEALIKAPATVTDPEHQDEVRTMENPEPHLKPYPSIDVAEYLTLKTL